MTTDSTKIETIVVETEDTPLDLLIWRRFQTRTPGLVERALALNVDLADKGLLIPVGTAVMIPIDAPDKAPAQRPVVRLWG
ncbi:tail protein X [Chelatococcus sp. XZ-Ab1]|uniref:tail protein X n=1 Tax=Chelatococcus sp. XZ-Ab1 TaxID=3034027 RepID=UPI0023E3F89E|nr:tail protein X [Chelatococcus sp. XZ-Ab1]